MRCLAIISKNWITFVIWIYFKRLSPVVIKYTVSPLPVLAELTVREELTIEATMT
jgi:hypothetical protein